MKKSLLALFALGSPGVFGQVPEKCENLTGDAREKCIEVAAFAARYRAPSGRATALRADRVFRPAPALN